jgi:hypothetical protein
MSILGLEGTGQEPVVWADWLRAQDVAVAAADALLAVASDTQRTRIEWVGRVGYRKDLADAALGWLAPASTHEQMAHLRHWLSCLLGTAECLHLAEARELLDAEPLPHNVARATLHLEAASFLAEDVIRLGVAPIPAVVAAWEQTALSLQKLSGGANLLPSADRVEMAPPVRAWIALLAAAQSYGRAGVLLQGAPAIGDLRQLLSDPFGDEPCESAKFQASALRSNASSAAGLIPAIRPFMALLARRRPETARRLLDARLMQDWAGIPGEWANALRGLRSSHDRAAFAHLVGSRSASELAARAAGLAGRPALVLHALVVMLASGLPLRLLPNDSLPEGLDAQLDALVELVKAASSGSMNPLDGDDGPLRGAWPTLPRGANTIAAALLNDKAACEMLAHALAKGSADELALQNASYLVDCELEGVALGVFGSLYGVLERARDVDEAALRAG